MWQLSNFPFCYWEPAFKCHLMQFLKTDFLEFLVPVSADSIHILHQQQFGDVQSFYHTRILSVKVSMDIPNMAHMCQHTGHVLTVYVEDLFGFYWSCNIDTILYYAGAVTAFPVAVELTEATCIWSEMQFISYTSAFADNSKIFNLLRPSDAYMRRWSYHHWFK